jgi:hypothetical protein
MSPTLNHLFSWAHVLSPRVVWVSHVYQILETELEPLVTLGKNQDSIRIDGEINLQLRKGSSLA